MKQKLTTSNNITLFVRNIPYDSTEEEIMTLFSQFGEVKAVRLPVCREDPTKLKGICFIDFHDTETMIKALDLDRYCFKGRYLKLDVDSSFDEITNSKIKTSQNNQINFGQIQQQGNMAYPPTEDINMAYAMYNGQFNNVFDVYPPTHHMGQQRYRATPPPGMRS